jgi:hypothetical protein
MQNHLFFSISAVASLTGIPSLNPLMSVLGCAMDGTEASTKNVQQIVA